MLRYNAFAYIQQYITLAVSVFFFTLCVLLHIYIICICLSLSVSLLIYFPAGEKDVGGERGACDLFVLYLSRALPVYRYVPGLLVYVLLCRSGCCILFVEAGRYLPVCVNE